MFAYVSPKMYAQICTPLDFVWPVENCYFTTFTCIPVNCAGCLGFLCTSIICAYPLADFTLNLRVQILSTRYKFNNSVCLFQHQHMHKTINEKPLQYDNCFYVTLWRSINLVLYVCCVLVYSVFCDVLCVFVRAILSWCP